MMIAVVTQPDSLKRDPVWFDGLLYSLCITFAQLLAGEHQTELAPGPNREPTFMSLSSLSSVSHLHFSA